MRIIDTHCHLDLYPDFQKVLAEIERNGIYTIAVTNTPSVFSKCAEITRESRFVRTAIGLHPELATVRQHELNLLDRLLPLTRYVGEIGLDYVTRDQADRATQRRVFSGFLDRCASVGDKVLTVHSRRAESDVVSMIGQHFPGTIILHWFSGSIADLDRAVSQGCYFSVNTAMVATPTGQRIVDAIPRNRLLTESDGPFVYIGKRPARPTDMSLVVAALSQKWNIDAAAAARQILDNFKAALASNSTFANET